jgi:hypothetical protein
MGQVPDDELRWVRRCGDDDLVALASQKGMVIVNSCNKVVLFYVLGTHAIFLLLFTYNILFYIYVCSVSPSFVPLEGKQEVLLQ